MKKPRNIHYAGKRTSTHAEKQGLRVITVAIVTTLIILALSLLFPIKARSAQVVKKAGPANPFRLVGPDGYSQEVSPEGHAEVEVHGPVTPFGDMRVAEMTPTIQQDFVYGASTDTTRIFKFNGASISTGNLTNLACAITGAQVNSLASIGTRRSLKYRAGQGGSGLHSGHFSTATVGSNQFMGLGSGEAALGFGTLDDKFGIYIASGNFREVQTLNIDTKASAIQTATLVLAGATYYCSVTNGANAAATAWEIANSTESSCDFSLQAPGWRAEAKGSSVTFVAISGGNQVGGMSITFPTSGAGTFTETVQGRLGSTEFVPQASWNVDTMDGSKASGSTTNPSGYSMDYTKSQVYRIDYQYLGGGNIDFSVEDPESGELNLVHRKKVPNSTRTPSLSNPNFSYVISARTTSGSTAMTACASSIAGFIDGKKEELGRQRNFRFYKTGIGTSFVPIMSIRNPLMFRGRPNQIEVKIREVVVANLATKGLEFALVRDPRLNNTASFSPLDGGTMIEVDTSATSYTPGVEQDGGAVGSANTIIQDLHGHQVALAPGDVVTVIARAVATTTDISVSVQAVEDR